jgi:hypothetical protein
LLVVAVVVVDMLVVAVLEVIVLALNYLLMTLHTQ